MLIGGSVISVPLGGGKSMGLEGEGIMMLGDGGICMEVGAFGGGRPDG